MSLGGLLPEKQLFSFLGLAIFAVFALFHESHLGDEPVLELDLEDWAEAPDLGHDLLAFENVDLGIRGVVLRRSPQRVKWRPRRSGWRPGGTSRMGR